MYVMRNLSQTYKKMLGENKLLREEKFKEYYEAFRDRFSPEKLKNLNGEAILDTMFNHGNKNSFVYWLEFTKENSGRKC
ncbi:MAG: hypothetical protein ABRQ38_08630 [Candidatus Eremiobacterota bacterium]